MSIFTIEQSKIDFANWMPLILTCNYFNILLYTSKVQVYTHKGCTVQVYRCILRKAYKSNGRASFLSGFLIHEIVKTYGEYPR